ncbi:Hypothetical predicted protein [Olea europaea subsp. europaea]|uniref:Uncharacterized protein n=1 Tax=Olea europaea subsp. europaea TaxID=158383 RepID=A0A8S0S0L6_OLEEU|nr:Hypothetical predicted protein [Olea europaea subsp. europaea]
MKLPEHYSKPRKAEVVWVGGNFVGFDGVLHNRYDGDLLVATVVIDLEGAGNVGFCWWYRRDVDNGGGNQRWWWYGSVDVVVLALAMGSGGGCSANFGLKRWWRSASNGCVVVIYNQDWYWIETGGGSV